MATLISKEHGRRVLIAGVAVEFLSLLRFFALPPKSGRELYPLMKDEPVSNVHRNLYYFLIAILGSTRLACLVKTPSFPLWLLNMWIHVMELVYFNTQAKEMKQNGEELTLAQKGFLYVIWAIPLSQLLVRDFE